MRITRLLIATFLSFAPAFGISFVVVPNAQTSSPGNSPNDLTDTPADFQFQEDFGSGQFLGIGGDLLISQLAFRAAPDSGPVNASISSASFSLSTTPYAPNNGGSNTLLTDTFATNLGPDNTVVYSGPVSLVSPGCTTSVCPFDIVVSFTTPFLYNPSQGKLLLYLQATGFTATEGSLDAESFNFPPGGSVASLFGASGDVSDTVNTAGDIVQFGYTLVPSPEPGTLMPAFVALLACVALLSRSKISRSMR
jgi:hypothetical protein